MPNVLSRRDLVSRPGKMDKTLLHRCFMFRMYCIMYITSKPFLTLLCSVSAHSVYHMFS